MSALQRRAAVLLVALCGSAGCTGTDTPTEDAGPSGIDEPGVCEESDPSVTPGVMGVTLCTEEGCSFGGGDCEKDAECFTPLADGATLPAWVRPQGGIGTRYNVRLEGVADADDKFETLRTLIVLERTGTECSEGDCPGPACPCDDDADETCLTTPQEGSECAVVLIDQLNRTFPTECRGDSAVHIEEIPVRFGIGFSLGQVDGSTVELQVHATYDGELYQAPTRDVVLEVGDFIYPASFDPLGG